ncbi:unnamed protein product [Sphagnum jensenii]|uniref:Uncharacterized protein n=1 Tax=Sphagnum jensenii TaxID=128206 RepID=A0ABP0VL49_9BRYO
MSYATDIFTDPDSEGFKAMREVCRLIASHVRSPALASHPDIIAACDEMFVNTQIPALKVLVKSYLEEVLRRNHPTFFFTTEFDDMFTHRPFPKDIADPENPLLIHSFLSTDESRPEVGQLVFFDFKDLVSEEITRHEIYQTTAAEDPDPYDKQTQFLAKLRDELTKLSGQITEQLGW